MDNIYRNIWYFIYLLVLGTGFISCKPWKVTPNEDRTISDFELRGNPQKVVLSQYQSSGKLFKKTTFRFNEDGKLIKKISEIHNPKQKVRYSVSQWVYDSKGFLIWTVKDTKKTHFINDRLGRKKKVWFYSHPDSLPRLKTYRYKNRKKICLSRAYNPDKTLYAKTMSLYNESNKILYSRFEIIDYGTLEETWWEWNEKSKNTVFKVYSNTLADTTYNYHHYDINGNLIKNRYIDKTGHQHITTFSYQFDQTGNWIERLKQEGDHKVKDSREILY